MPEEVNKVLLHNSGWYPYEVEDLVGIRMRDNECQNKAKWLGLDFLDASWEPYDVLREDIPVGLHNFLSN